MNNFNMDTLKNFEKTGPFYGLMEPLIVTKANEIHTVYAGTAGHSSVSLDMPRKMTTLAYSLFHNFTLQQAFTMPLIYSHNPNEIIVKGEIPYVRFISKQNYSRLSVETNKYLGDNGRRNRNKCQDC